MPPPVLVSRVGISFIFMLVFIVGTASARPKFIGNDACIQCHKKEGLSWSKQGHAKAFERLKPGNRKAAKKRVGLDPDKDYTKDRVCLRCHTTGYKKRGGYKDAESTPGMQGVGCEACHGAGSEYKVLHDEKPNFIEDEAKALGELYPSQDGKICDDCHINKDQHFTEKVDEKYKYNREEAIKNREGLHEKFEKRFRSMF